MQKVSQLRSGLGMAELYIFAETILGISETAKYRF
jgi:hypothetical protein